MLFEPDLKGFQNRLLLFIHKPLGLTVHHKNPFYSFPRTSSFFTEIREISESPVLCPIRFGRSGPSVLNRRKTHHPLPFRKDRKETFPGEKRGGTSSGQRHPSADFSLSQKMSTEMNFSSQKMKTPESLNSLSRQN